MIEKTLKDNFDTDVFYPMHYRENLFYRLKDLDFIRYRKPS